jgi:hypothetical protein
MKALPVKGGNLNLILPQAPFGMSRPSQRMLGCRCEIAYGTEDPELSTASMVLRRGCKKN